MTQSKRDSMFESLANGAVRFLYGFALTYVVWPMCGIDGHVGQRFGVTTMYLLIGIATSYFIRRAFNRKKEPQDD